MNLSKLQANYDFTGRTALVTGGAGVLGFEIARTLVAIRNGRRGQSQRSPKM
jgi:NAD(P)-dependent dehydrogenase (short-subunit alcohol dehydrogenase family)